MQGQGEPVGDPLVAAVECGAQLSQLQNCDDLQQCAEEEYDRDLAARQLEQVVQDQHIDAEEDRERGHARGRDDTVDHIADQEGLSRAVDESAGRETEDRHQPVVDRVECGS